MNTCALGDACSCEQSQRASCANWSPSRGSKYYYCTRYTAGRITCDLPRSACQTCPHFEGADAEGDLGRPNMSGIDWKDDDDRRAYMREYMKQRRKNTKEKTNGSSTD